MPYSFTNRRDTTYYFKAVPTKKGSVRYYKTTSKKAENLIDEVPNGYEVIEKAFDATVVIRKIIQPLITQEEKEILHDAVEEFSALNDFFVQIEGKVMTLFHSQFNHIGGVQFQGEKNLSRKEAIEMYGKNMNKFISFHDGFRMVLVDKNKRLFQAQRIVNMSFFGFTYHPISPLGKVEDLALKISPYIGTENWYKIAPNGYASSDDIIIT